MSKNDIAALEAEYNHWLAERAPGLTKVDPFEFFCADQLLKDFRLSDEDILSGIVGKSNDGGTDSLFFLVGQKLVQDDTDVPDQRGLTVNLIFIQSKGGDGFSPLGVDRFQVLTDDILDLQRQPTKYGRTYHKDLLHRIKIFKEAFQKLSLPRLVVDYYYVTRLDVVENQDCITAAERVEATVRKHFSQAEVHPFHFVNAAKLYTQLYKRPASEKSLHFVELVGLDEGWIGLVRLKDFYTFLKGDDRGIIDRLFEDNVRGFQRDTRVNVSIYDTLERPAEMPEFWLLNNGITILSPDAQTGGGKVLKITDPQIVNGLQTSRQIFSYFNAGQSIPDNDNRRILVKVIKNSDEDTRDQIIRATNNQNPMPSEALFTTSRIHKQIEATFKANGLYYERRRGYYRDQKKPIAKIVSALSVVQAIVAIIERSPNVAQGRPRDYINDKDKRYKIFGHDDYDDSRPMDKEVAKHQPYDLSIYLQCARIVRRVDKFLDIPKLKLDNEAKRNILFYLARYVACAATGSAYSPPGDIVRIDVDALTDDFLREGLKVVKRIYKRYGGNDEAGKSPRMVSALDKWLVQKFSPPNVQEDKKSRKSPTSGSSAM